MKRPLQDADIGKYFLNKNPVTQKTPKQLTTGRS